MYNRLLIFVLLCFAFAIAMPVYGGTEESEQKGQDDSEPMWELLLMQDIPVVVVTPAKKAQPILESPSTITVLTKEDIRRYGITNLTDILRNVPGVDVMSVSATDRNVSIRGFNQLAAGKILSLVDGRPIYLDFYGMTAWAFLPVSIEEIERIEIIRGPGSALYGANAFDGVVNIITRSQQTAGTEMTVKANQYREMGGLVIHNGIAGDLSYRTSIGLEPISGWDDETKDDGENRLMNGFLKYDIDDTSHIDLSGNVQEYRGDIIVSQNLEPARHSGTRSNLQMNYAKQSLECSAFWNRFITNAESKGTLSSPLEDNTDSRSPKYTELPSYRIESNTVNVELQHSFQPLVRNFITWGLSYRFNRMDSELLDSEHSQNLVAGYIQDQIRLLDSLELTAGLRYDRHPLTGNNFSPRGSMVYSPFSGHALRVSVGRAFQNPSSVYSYLSTDYRMSLSMLPEPFKVRLTGNRELSPELISSLELGYRGRISDRVKVNVDTFFNRLFELTDIIYPESYDRDALYPGSPGGLIPSVAQANNVRDAEALGGEMSVDLSITDWLWTHVNYSYQRVSDLKTGEDIESAPRHKINPSLYVRLGSGLGVSIFANYVDRTVWDNVELESYTLLNSAISYRMGNTVVNLSAFNMLNKRHQEHPKGNEIGRSIVLSLTYQIN